MEIFLSETCGFVLHSVTNLLIGVRFLVFKEHWTSVCCSHPEQTKTKRYSTRIIILKIVISDFFSEKSQTY
jgi:isopentenyldiphosphate isomerase